MYINPMDFTYMQWNKPADLPAELFLFLESLPKEETEHPRLGRVIHAQKFARPILIRYFHEYTHMALCKAMCVYWELDAEERGYFSAATRAAPSPTPAAQLMSPTVPLSR